MSNEGYIFPMKLFKVFSISGDKNDWFICKSFLNLIQSLIDCFISTFFFYKRSSITFFNKGFANILYV